MSPTELQSLIGKTISDVYVKVDEPDIWFVSLAFEDGTEVEISGTGMHTEGWPVFEWGRERRDRLMAPQEESA